MDRAITGWVSVLGGSLLCPGVGSVCSSSMNRSVTGCVPALGVGLPCPGVGSVGSSSINRLVTHCVPTLGGGLSCPGISRVGVSNMGFFSLAPFGARFDDAVSDQVCPLPHLQLPGALV